MSLNIFRKTSLNFDLHNLKNWLIEHECFDVCMESTGKYWIPVFNVLETEAKINIALVHPKYVKAISLLLFHLKIFVN